MPQLPSPRAMHALFAVAATTIACALPHADRRVDGSMTDGSMSMDADAEPPPPACEAGVVCNDACALTMTDPNNCGACGFQCNLAHATAACAAGRCTIAMCEAGWGDCNNNPADGCEVRLNTLENCGGCGTICTARMNATADCSTGTCTPRCFPNYDDCDSDLSNGCEPLNTTANCMRCGNVCSGSTPVCDAANGCVSGCGSLSNCSGSCVNTANSPEHCGRCGNACPMPANAAPTCAAGTCGFTCNIGFENCDGMAGNGCEANIRTATAHCGRCGNACPTPANATPLCNAGVCSFRCNTGFGDCDGNAANGCETNLNSSTTHCGMCGRTCAGAANAAATCSAGTCGFTCNTGFGDCNANASDGCEVDTRTSVSHCGTCMNACPSVMGAAPTCAASTCGFACSAGRANCDMMAGNGCEADTNTSLMHCGGCGMPCSRSNATASCSAGMCSLGMCNAGFGNCDGMDANGCEQRTNTLTHCGACGTACARAGATATCSTGTCAIAMCNAGLGNCDGMDANGCETTTNTLTHCGACGMACARNNATATCSTGTCAIAMCSAGFGNCDGMDANGCETNTNSSNTHCGGCMMACPTNSACSTGACVCGAGYSECGGSAGHPAACCDDATEICSAGACVAAPSDAGGGG
ncbi:MAG: hypothetical protein U0269_20965 [Polyangiales bacterium]